MYRGEGGSKKAKNLRTYYVHGPLSAFWLYIRLIVHGQSAEKKMAYML